jgi:hypothetical protein
MTNETLDDEQRPSEDFKMLTTTKQTANRIIKGVVAEICVRWTLIEI